MKNGCSIGKYCNIETWEVNAVIPRLVFCENCCIGEYNHISASNYIYIGKNVLTGRRVTIIDNNHGSFEKYQLSIAPLSRPVVSKGPIIIDDNVWIGENAVILSGVHIGEGAIIAANAVVTKDVDSYTMVAGVPAKPVKILS